MKTRGGPPDTAVTFAVRHGVIPVGSPKHSAHGEDRPMGAYYVGLDVHSRETVFVIQDPTGLSSAAGRCPRHLRPLRVCVINISSQSAHRSLWRPEPRLFMW